ncbi:MAG: hypothetical protein BWY28_02318 [bacterium ADurb.Bin236]|nr:MAG: hypothetical protein BWY28_02318 [bacterium ADurb.Bin236]HOY63859.1 hypothetical protein [bacterium]
MSKTFSMKRFLIATSNESLAGYFTAKGISIEVDLTALGEADSGPIMKSIQEMPRDVSSRIENDFRDIHALSYEGGIKTLLAETRDNFDEISDALLVIDGHEDKVMWVFLNKPEVFESASTWHRIDTMTRWRHRKNLPKARPATDDETKAALAGVLSEYFREEARGRNCEVETYERPDCVCYHAFPEDYATTDMCYDEDGRLQRRIRKSVFEIIFCYHPDEGRLSINGGGRKDQIDMLCEMFTDNVLKIPAEPDLKNDRVFDLSGLKNRDFEFVTDPADNVEFVRVKSLGFSVVGNSGRKIALEADPDNNGNRQAVYDHIDQSINKENVPADQMLVKKATIQMKFPGKGNHGSVTFEIGWPDSCTLKDGENHRKVKEYLKRWGIDKCATQ